MNYAETILPEFDREMANTRKVLERVPENKLDWQAHPKSHTIGWNANHLAEILGWVEG
jgi:DinB superfamily